MNREHGTVGSHRYSLVKGTIMAIVRLGEVLARLEHDLTLSDADLVAALAIDVRTLDRWRNDVSFPQREARTRLDKLEQIRSDLLDLFTDEQAVRTWMRTESRYLGGLTQAEVIRASRLDRVEAAATALASGAFI